MLKLPKEEISYWRDGISETTYPKLTEDLEVDVAIAGGGICGLTSAYLLKRSGLSVAVVENEIIGSGTTGHTTGKVTSQHNLIYDELRSQLGERHARLYGEANQAAIKQIESIIAEAKIDCDWRQDDNYVFTTEVEQIQKFKTEAKVAARLGLPATYETKTPLPFNIKAAVKFSGQGKFNSQKYIAGLAAAINGGGSYVFENSRAINFHDKTPCTLSASGAKITAKDIIVATNVPPLPLIARGAYCVLEYPTTSYIVAGSVANNLSGMYISPDDDHYSILPIPRGKKRMLLIGGNDHIRGPRNTEKRYQELADYAEQRFGMTSIEYRWSAWDYIAYDNVPLVGKMYPWSKHMYVATAFKKWGLTGTTVAAMILHDTLLGKENAWAKVYNSMRLSPIKSIPKVAASYIKS